MKTKIMKNTKMKNTGFLFLLLMIFSITLQAQTEEKVIIKKTKDKNGIERDETMTTKDGQTKVTVTVDGKAVKEETIIMNNEAIIIKNGDQTFFIEEMEDLTEEIELTFEDLELTMNNIEIPNIRMGVLEENPTKDDEGYLGVELEEQDDEVSDLITVGSANVEVVDKKMRPV